jgi:hypothetical protein
MTQEHPITPPPELIRKWNVDAVDAPIADKRYIATQAARWGADQELEACCEYISRWFATPEYRAAELRAARRPKPPSLKEQALLQLDTLNADLSMHGMGCDLSQIRRALESLPE